MDWLYLALAIVSEVTATSALKAIDGLAKFLPIILVAGGYGAALVFQSLALRSIPLGIVYVIWSGAGVALISLVGWLVYSQSLDAPAVVGIGLILSGVTVLNLYSKTIEV
jgi:small multidrug resistance pump